MKSAVKYRRPQKSLSASVSGADERPARYLVGEFYELILLFVLTTIVFGVILWTMRRQATLRILK